MKRVLFLALLLLGAGCDKKGDAPASSGPTTADEKPAALTDDDVPVKSDFVEEAESSINKDNYKSELDKISAEIDKE